MPDAGRRLASVRVRRSEFFELLVETSHGARQGRRENHRILDAGSDPYVAPDFGVSLCVCLFVVVPAVRWYLGPL